MAQSAETSVQGLVHNLEQGSLAAIVRRTLLVVAVLAVASIYIIYKFRGLENGMGMDQAQIAREIARGKGFVTQTIRPLAIAQMESHGKPISGFRFPDTYHAPLNPLIEAPLMLFVKGGWDTEAKNQNIVYAGDRLVAILAVVFFLLAVIVNYFTACQLFDDKLAILGSGLTLVCDLFWKYSMSGLPQMLMLLIFSAIVHLLVRALNAQAEGRAFGLTLGSIGRPFWAVAIGARTDHLDFDRLYRLCRLCLHASFYHGRHCHGGGPDGLFPVGDSEYARFRHSFWRGSLCGFG